MMVNVELMQKTLDYIAMHPDEHDQSDWAQKSDCGTTRCMAGTAVHVAPGYKLMWHNRPAEEYDYTSQAVDEDGRVYAVRDLAEDLLGVDYSQARDLFYEAADLDDLYDMAERFTGIDMRPEAARELVPA